MRTVWGTLWSWADRFDTRGQSEVVAVILVMGIVLVGALAVVGLGASAIGGTESQLSDDRAEKTMTQLDSKAGLVALGESSSQRVSLPTGSGDQYRVNEDDGWIRITVTNLSDSSEDFEVMEESLGAIIYENGDSTVAYQGGGVWRATEHGGMMISPPEFHYRNGTLTLPAITVTGDSSLGSSARIEKASEIRTFPDHAEDRFNPLDNHRVDVTVQSDYYVGWGSYFSERTDGDVEYDHENEKVTATLVTPVNINEITAASASLSAGGEFNVKGTSALTCEVKDADDVYTSSYNSSKGTGYCEQFTEGPSLADRLPGTSGDMMYGEDIDISDGVGGSSFYGDLTSGATVTVKDGGEGQPYVYGNISYVDQCTTDDEEGDCQERIDEDFPLDPEDAVHQIDGIQTTESIDWFIETAVGEIQLNADETNPDIAGETLEAGEYYFDSFDLGADEKVTLDTSDGPVIIAVGEDATLDDGANISVIGNDHVQFFVRGTESGDDFIMENNARVSAPNDNSTKFRLYGKSDFDARMGGGGSGNLAVFTGVIYAPPGSAGTGSVTLDGAVVFGGILTGQTTIDGGSIHYDEALEGETVVPEDAYVISVTYLHVSHSVITVSG